MASTEVGRSATFPAKGVETFAAESSACRISGRSATFPAKGVETSGVCSSHLPESCVAARRSPRRGLRLTRDDPKFCELLGSQRDVPREGG